MWNIPKLAIKHQLLDIFKHTVFNKMVTHGGTPKHTSHTSPSSAILTYGDISSAYDKFVSLTENIKSEYKQVNEAVEQVIKDQVQLNREFDEAHQRVHQVATRYRLLADATDTITQDFKAHTIDWNEFLRATVQLIAHGCTDVLDETGIIEIQNGIILREEMFKQGHEKVKEAQEKVNSTAITLVQDMKTFLPCANAFINNMRCKCLEYEGCGLHAFEPKGRVFQDISNLIQEIENLITELDTAVNYISSQQHAASPGSEADITDTPDNGLQDNFDDFMVGGCSICGQMSHTTLTCPWSYTVDPMMMSSGALQAADEVPATIMGCGSTKGDDDYEV